MSSKNKEKSEFIRKISLILQNPMGEGDKEILHTLQGNMDELFLAKQRVLLLGHEQNGLSLWTKLKLLFQPREEMC